MSKKNVDLGKLGAVALKVAVDKGTKTVAKTVVALDKTDMSSLIKWGTSAVITKSVASAVGGSFGEVLDNIGDGLSIVAGVSAIRTVNKFHKNYKKVTDEDINKFLAQYDEEDEDDE